MSWPKEVPVLGPKDIVNGRMKCGSRRCLTGWLDHVFPFKHFDEREKAWETMHGLVGNHEIWGIVAYNDSHTPTENARAWNKAMAKLGYTVGNPEA